MKVYRRIIKIGNSKGVIIPKGMFEKDLELGDWVEIKMKKVR